jgi:hypothetical protein
LYWCNFSLAALVTFFVFLGYIYSTIGLTLIIGYHSYMVFTYITQHGTNIFVKLLKKCKDYYQK